LPLFLSQDAEDFGVAGGAGAFDGFHAVFLHSAWLRISHFVMSIPSRPLSPLVFCISYIVLVPWWSPFGVNYKIYFL